MASGSGASGGRSTRLDPLCPQRPHALATRRSRRSPRSIRECGWTNPVLVDEDGGIIAGHGRVLAARKLGMTEVPVMVAAGWTEAQKRAYVLADNKLALNAGWDEDLLGLELRASWTSSASTFDLTGFDDDEIAALLASGAGLTDPDEVPELPAEPVSRLGDVWLLGRHRLVCGDSTDAGGGRRGCSAASSRT